MDPRTLRAAAIADVSTFLTIGGLGWAMGFPPGPAFITGAVLGGLAFLLIVLAARRAETFSPTESTAHLRLDRDLDAPADDTSSDAVPSDPAPSNDVTEDDR